MSDNKPIYVLMGGQVEGFQPHSYQRRDVPIAYAGDTDALTALWQSMRACDNGFREYEGKMYIDCSIYLVPVVDSKNISMGCSLLTNHEKVLQRVYFNDLAHQRAMGWQQEYQQVPPEPPLCPGCDARVRTDGLLRHESDCPEEESFRRTYLKNDEKTQLYSASFKKLE